MTRQYYDGQERPKILFYYRGGDQNKPILTMIRLADQGWFTPSILRISSGPTSLTSW